MVAVAGRAPANPLASRAGGRAVGDGLIVAGLLFAAFLFVAIAPSAGTFGFDAFAYWSVSLADPYAATAGALGAFTYSPVIARLFAPASLLPWWQFLTLWLAVLVATGIWLGRRSPRTILAVFAFPPVALELYHGNVHLLLAAAIVLGLRYPAVWSFAILTKVTPGIGLVWFVVRREWRSLGIALAVTAAITAVSLLVDGRLWAAWLTESLGRTAAGAPLNQASIAIPLWFRLPVAGAIVAWGARTDRRWTIAVAVTLALPVLWPTGFAILAAIPWLNALDRAASTSAPASVQDTSLPEPGAPTSASGTATVEPRP